ncbi:hypothetical protein [Streptomyces sp. NPDC018055]|uniref:hypothetical protein n=1 Tax=Streptomyces sp. NPDC018055 TaxID=3365038 RepID=UPI0037B11F13
MTEQLEWPRMTPETWEATTRQLPTRRAYLDHVGHETVARVIALHEQWVKAGSPPLGTSVNRWWDRRLIELDSALTPPADEQDRPLVETLRERPGDQPLPTAGQESVQDALIKHIEKRRELGIQRYGTPLQTFNGRNAVRDALEEALDLATYLMQVEMEQAARQAGLREALKLHEADQGLCRTCAAPSPCATRQALVPPHQPPVPGGELAFTTSTVHPVEEVAVHPDTLTRLEGTGQRSRPRSAAESAIDQLMGLPIVTDSSLSPGHVRMRPRGFDQHKEKSTS